LAKLADAKKHDLTDLDADINEEELHIAIKQMPTEKAPGPDGYIGAFYKKYWEIIKADLVAAIQQIFQLKAKAWELLNPANITLIAKEGAEMIELDDLP
jgi:hypothetical protein